MRIYVLKQYNSKVKRCDLCGELFKLGDVIVKTSTRHYHKRCFQKLPSLTGV